MILPGHQKAPNAYGESEHSSSYEYVKSLFEITKIVFGVGESR